MFDDFGFNGGFDDFNSGMNDLYYQQDAMQQELFQQQQDQFQQQQFDSMRQYATATGRIPAAGNNTAKTIPATSYYRFHLFLIRRNTEKGAACQKAVP